jgi:hypothetical protein
MPDVSQPPEGAALDEAAASLRRMLYVSQVYAGETYARMLTTYHGLSPGQRRKIEACRRLEIARGRLLFDHMTGELGLALRPPSRARQAAITLAALPHGTWSERMADLEGASIRGVAGYRALRALYGARQPQLCALLLAQEMALRDFARDELDGETEESSLRIIALLSPEDRDAVAAFEGSAPSG